MSIICGDFVRPNKPGVGLPLGSVWRVVCSAGALKLDAENDAAQSARHVALGCRYPEHNFDKVVLCRGQWVDVRDADFLRAPASLYDGAVSASATQAADLAMVPDAVTTATVAAEQASNAADAIACQLEAARKLEAERKAELRAAKAAKAKADKEAAPRAKAEDARKALAAKLHADRCLGEATLALIAEVSRLNNGGSEQVADASIAQHVDQLQALAKSYGYRIAKPSMIALVVKL